MYKDWILRIILIIFTSLCKFVCLYLYYSETVAYNPSDCVLALAHI